MNEFAYSFTNHFLIAMPMLKDPNFGRAVVYICEHNENGAIGIVVNNPLSLNLGDIFQQMKIVTEDTELIKLPVLCGGPMQNDRGFVIHTVGGNWRLSLDMENSIAVTTSCDILQAIAEKRGPDRTIISLGYASWSAGQLEEELVNNFWLIAPVSSNNSDILFTVPFNDRWIAAMHSLGVHDPNKLVYYGGCA